MMSEETGMAFCPQCGRKVPDNAKFCPSCGHKLELQSVPDKLEKQEATISESTAKHNVNGVPTRFDAWLRWLKSFVTKAKSIFTRDTISKKYVIYSIIALFVIIGFIWYKTSSTDTASAVEGKIFICKMGDKGKYKDMGYFVFGGKKNGYGSLYVSTNSKSHIDHLNASGELANMLSSQSDDYTRFWDTENNGKKIKWVNGLTTDVSLDDVTFHDTSMDVQKVSGVFGKTISGVFHDTTYDFAPESETITFTQYATIKN